jgi:hypothetical protein
MPRVRELALQGRAKICEAKVCGLTSKQIAIRHEVSIDTARYTTTSNYKWAFGWGTRTDLAVMHRDPAAKKAVSLRTITFPL